MAQPSLDDIYQQSQQSVVPQKASLDDIYNQSQPQKPPDIVNNPKTLMDDIARVPQVYANSAGKMISGIGNAITHPVETTDNIVDAVAHPIDAINNYVKGRYDTPQNIMKTLANDPIGVVADASGVMGGAGGALAKVGEANNLSKVADVGNAMTSAASVPTKALVKGAQAVAQPIAKTASNIADTSVLAKNGIANMLLNPEYKQTAADWDYNHDPRRIMATDPGLIGDNHIETKALIDNRTKETGKLIGDTIANSEVSKKPIGLTEQDIVGHIDDAITTLNKSDPDENAATINKLMQKRIALTSQFDKDGNIIGSQDFSNMTPQQAFDFKEQKLGNIKYTGNDATDTKAVNSALQKSRANIVSKMNQALPDLKPLNQDYGDLKAASEATDRAAFKAQGQSLGNIHWQDILTLGINKWLNSPTNRIRFAQFLYTTPKAQIQTVSQMVPGFQSAINSVYGSASSDTIKALPAPKNLGQPIPKQYAPDYMPPSSNSEEPIPMRGPSLKATTNQTNPSTNIGPYQSVSPNAMDALIKAHREVAQGNVGQDDVQNAIDMANHFNQNNISQTGMNVKKFGDLDSLNKFVSSSPSKVELISTDANGNFYAHLKQGK